MRARYYSVETRRFLNADPIGFGGGMNWYAFAGGNPVVFGDVKGFKPEIVYVNGTSTVYGTGNEFHKALIAAEPASIMEIRFDGEFTEHGNSMMQVVSSYAFVKHDAIIIQNGRMLLTNGYKGTLVSIDEILRNKMTAGSTLYFTGCNTAQGPESLSEKASKILGSTIEVKGNREVTWGFAGKRWLTFGGDPVVFLNGNQKCE